MSRPCTGPNGSFRRRYGALLYVGAVAAALQAAPTAVRSVLEYQRSAILHGELWRVFTAHLVHANWAHLGADLAGFFLICTLPASTRELKPAHVVAILAWSGLVVSAGLLMFDPQMKWYLGLSGVLYGLLVALMPQLWRESRRIAAVLTVGLAAKLMIEQTYGPIPGTEAILGIPVAVDAHLFGVIAGSPVALARLLRSPHPKEGDALNVGKADQPR